MERVVIRWRAMVLICAVVLIGFAWAFWGNYQDVRAAEARQAALQQSITRLQAEQNNLTRELEQVGSVGYLENRAREDYAFIKPGELRFEVINPDDLKGYTKEELQIVMDEIFN